MKFSKKGPAPQLFVDWLTKANDDWQPRYSDLQNPEIGEVRRALLFEQEFVCAYCGRALSHDQSDSHIDHFRPQKIYNGKDKDDFTLSFSNFVASCGPPDRSGRSSTCGDAKGSQFDDTSYIEPWDPGCEERFLYGSSGYIQATDEADHSAKTMIRILKLDDESLILDRRTILQALEADISAGVLQAEEIPGEIQRLRAAVDGRRISFSHMAARYLEEEFAV